MAYVFIFNAVHCQFYVIVHHALCLGICGFINQECCRCMYGHRELCHTLGLRGGAKKVQSSLFFLIEGIGQTNRRLWTHRLYLGNLYKAAWLIHLPFCLTLTELFMETKGVGWHLVSFAITDVFLTTWPICLKSESWSRISSTLLR